MMRHPLEAELLIRTLGLGEAPAHQAGLRATAWRSRRYDGVIYEIAMGGPYHPLVIQRDGEWQVIRVEHADDVARASASLTPIAGR